jgi:hypothetical protein
MKIPCTFVYLLCSNKFFPNMDKLTDMQRSRDIVYNKFKKDIINPGVKEFRFTLDEALVWYDNDKINSKNSFLLEEHGVIILYHITFETIFIDHIVPIVENVNYYKILECLKNETSTNFILQTSNVEYKHDFRISNIKKIEKLFDI